MFGPAGVKRGSAGVVRLSAGTPLYQGDLVETGAEGLLIIEFVDGTTFHLYADACVELGEFAYGPDKPSNSARLRVVKGKFGFMAGDVAARGRLSVDTPLATIRNVAGVGSLAFVFVLGLVRELEAASEDITFIDDGTLTYKDLEYGVFEIVTHGVNPQVIVVDNPAETIILRPRGSGSSIDRIVNTPQQMAELQGTYQRVFSTFALGQQDAFIQQFIRQSTDRASNTLTPLEDQWRFAGLNLNPFGQPVFTPSQIIPAFTIPIGASTTNAQGYVTYAASVSVLPISNDQHAPLFLGPSSAANPNVAIRGVSVPAGETLVSIHISGLPPGSTITDGNGNVYSGNSITISAGNFRSGLTLSGPPAAGALIISATVLGPGGLLTSPGVTLELTLDLQSAVRWVNAAGGDWHVASNWSTGAVPIPFQDVILPAGSYVVTSSADVFIDSVLVGSGVTLQISGGDFSLTTANDEPLSNAGTIIVGMGARLDVGDATFAGVVVNTGTLRLDGGSVNFLNVAVNNTSGTVVIEAPAGGGPAPALHLKGATISFGTIANHGVLDSADGGASTIRNAVSFSNDGTVRVSGNGNSLLLRSTTLVNAIGGTGGTVVVEAASGAGLAPLLMLHAAVITLGTVTNHGVLEARGGAASTIVDVASFSNDGTVRVAGNGTSLLLDSITLANAIGGVDGTIFVAAASGAGPAPELELQDVSIVGGVVTNNGVFAVSGGASNSLTGVVMTSAGTLAVTGAGVMLTLDRATTVNSSGIVDIGAGATLDVDGVLNLLSGAAFGPGTGALTVGGTLTADDNDLSFGGTLSGGGTVDVNGGLTLGGTANSLSGVLDIDGTLTVAALGELTLADGSSFAGAGSLVVAGTLHADDNDLSFGGTLSGGGTVDVNGGLTLGGTANSLSGVLDIDGTLTVAALGELTLADGSSFAGAGSLVVAGTLHADDNDLSFGGTLSGGGTVDVNGGLTLGGTANSLSGVLDIDGTLTVAALGELTLADGSSLAGAGSLVVAGTLHADDNDLSFGGTLSGGGTVDVNGGLTLGGTANSLSGVLDIDGTLTVAALGELTLADGSSLAGAGSLVVAGSLHADDNDLSFGGTLSGGGTVDVNGGLTLGGTANSLSGVLDIDGTLTVAALGELTLADGSSFAGAGSLVVAGTLHADDNDLSFGGTLSGGGTVDVNGGLTLGGAANSLSGVLEIDGTLTVGRRGRTDPGGRVRRLPARVRSVMAGTLHADDDDLSFGGTLERRRHGRRQRRADAERRGQRAWAACLRSTAR